MNREGKLSKNLRHRNEKCPFRYNIGVGGIPISHLTGELGHWQLLAVFRGREMMKEKVMFGGALHAQKISYTFQKFVKIHLLRKNLIRCLRNGVICISHV